MLCDVTRANKVMWETDWSQKIFSMLFFKPEDVVATSRVHFNYPGRNPNKLQNDNLGGGEEWTSVVVWVVVTVLWIVARAASNPPALRYRCRESGSGFSSRKNGFPPFIFPLGFIFFPFCFLFFQLSQDLGGLLDTWKLWGLLTPRQYLISLCIILGATTLKEPWLASVWLAS